MSPCRTVVIALFTLTAACGGPAAPNVPAAPNQAVVASVQVAPSSLNLLEGTTGALAATARDAQGNVLPGAAFTWTSQATNVATVSSNGTVTALVTGTTIVSATSGGVQGSATVNVTPALVLTVSPLTATTTAGGSVAFSVTAKDVNGRLYPTPPVTWSSLNPAVATVSSTGVATGVAAGTTAIVASASPYVPGAGALAVTTTGRCNDIASRTTFAALITWQFARNETNRENHEIGVLHRTSLASTLSRVSSPLEDEQSWTGPLSGTASVTDYDINNNSPPPNRSTMSGGGNVLASVNGNPLPGVTLTVDLLTCTYRFETTPWIDMVLTEPDGRTEKSPLPLGTLWVGWRPLGAWAQTGVIVSPQPYLWDAHGITWLTLPGNAFKDAYFPHGFGQLFFVKPVNPTDLTVPGPSGGWTFR
jgi:Bacterial Ig-like domain (group 2)